MNTGSAGKSAPAPSGALPRPEAKSRSNVVATAVCWMAVGESGLHAPAAKRPSRERCRGLILVSRRARFRTGSRCSAASSRAAGLAWAALPRDGSGRRRTGTAGRPSAEVGGLPRRPLRCRGSAGSTARAAPRQGRPRGKQPGGASTRRLQGLGGSPLSWRFAVPWADRGTFIEMAAAAPRLHGWDAAVWPGEITAAMTVHRLPATPAGTGATRPSGCTRARRGHHWRTPPTSLPSPPQWRPRASSSGTSTADCDLPRAAASASAD